MNLKCIICYKPADVMWDGCSFCKKHFELHWGHVQGYEYGESVRAMKKKEDDGQGSNKKDSK